jgi:hypothetical protein
MTPPFRITIVVVVFVIFQGTKAKLISDDSNEGLDSIYTNALSQGGPDKNCLQPSSNYEAREDEIDKILEELPCYTRVEDEDFDSVLNASFSSTAERYKYNQLPSKYCPHWPKSKSCLVDFLQGKCSRDEIQLAKASSELGIEIALYSSLCDPNPDQDLLHFLKKFKETGLTDCLTRIPAFAAAVQDCVADNELSHPSADMDFFKIFVGGIAPCARTFFHLCKDSDTHQMGKMQAALNELLEYVLISHDLFWNPIQQY